MQEVGERNRSVGAAFETRGWSQQRGNYEVRFAANASDLEQVQALRYAVFAQEMGAVVVGAECGLDLDPLDASADHLMVIDRVSGECVGTYRLVTREQLREDGAPEFSAFYARRIFRMEQLDPRFEAEGVELGRACVAVAHRTRGVFQLLLRGIGQFLVLSGKRYLFGCGSVPLKDPDEADAAIAHIQSEGWLDPALIVSPMPGFEVHRGSATTGALPEVPPLLSAYGAMGARFAPSPAYDPDFSTLDFFVLLDLERVNPRVYARYCGQGGGRGPR